MEDLDDKVLGEASGRLAVASFDDNRRAAIALARQGRETLHLFTPDLERPVYDDGEFLDALRRLAMRGPRAKVQILVIDPRRALLDGHRLVETARRLTSHIEVRRVAADFRDHPEAFLIVDGRGLLHRKLHTRPEGELDFNAPGEANLLLKFFREVWEKSVPDPELRRLHI